MKVSKKINYRLISVVLMTVIMIIAVGCHKNQKIIKVFEYEKNDDGTVRVTGLTDKGKNDSKLTIPSELDGAKVTTIDAGAFRDDNLVTEVIISDGIETISENVFLNCSMLENITIPESVKNIGTNAFTDTKWEHNQYETHTEIVVNDILAGVKSGINEYTVPNSVKRIAAGIFYNNKDIKKVNFNSSLESIGDYAFSGCTGLTSLKIPDSVTEIGYCAFSNCTGLDISIPSTVKNIKTDAFQNVSHLNYTGTLAGKPWGALAVN